MLRNHWFFFYSSVVNFKSLLLSIKAEMWALLLVIPLLLTSAQLSAGQAVALYEVSIPVVDESASVRRQAFKQGLDEVFIRVAGDSIVMDKLKSPEASRYIKQFRYEPVQASTTNAQGERLTHRLKIQYNGSLIEKYLLENGFPVWGEHRPDVVIWLAVRDGNNEYVLKDSDQSQLKTVTEEAMVRRGIPERWPLYDYTDRKILSVADIRGGFKDPVIRASQRYSRGPALTGSMLWNGKEWQSSWSLILHEGNHHWSMVDSDYKVMINKAVDQAADALGVVFAVHNAAGKQQLVTIRLHIQAVNSVEKYRFVENYLTGLSSVEVAMPMKLDGQTAVFELRLRSSEADFLNLIHNDAELVKVKAVKPQVTTLQVTAPQTSPQLITENGSATDAGTLADNTLAKQDAVVSADPITQVPVYYYKLNR
jgi:uncharacterized protein